MYDPLRSRIPSSLSWPIFIYFKNTPCIRTKKWTIRKNQKKNQKGWLQLDEFDQLGTSFYALHFERRFFWTGQVRHPIWTSISHAGITIGSLDKSRKKKEIKTLLLYACPIQIFVLKLWLIFCGGFRWWHFGFILSLHVYINDWFFFSFDCNTFPLDLATIKKWTKSPQSDSHAIINMCVWVCVCICWTT